MFIETKIVAQMANLILKYKRCYYALLYIYVKKRDERVLVVVCLSTHWHKS